MEHLGAASVFLLLIAMFLSLLDLYRKNDREKRSFEEYEKRMKEKESAKLVRTHFEKRGS